MPLGLYFAYFHKFARSGHWKDLMGERHSENFLARNRGAAKNIESRLTENVYASNFNIFPERAPSLFIKRKGVKYI